MRWVDAERTLDGVNKPVKIFNFSVNAEIAGGIAVANSNGLIPIPDENGVPIPGQFEPFDQAMYDRFSFTIDQLEGEINVPYIFQRDVPFQIYGNTFGRTEIIVPHSLLGGFIQLRINYQYIAYGSDGEVVNGSVVTPRTIVPRFVPPPPPPPPPVFTIDDGQIKEALADKVYEKFFNSDVIQADISEIMSLQTTTSEDGVGYETGRTDEEQQLILFKKDRNTPENKKDFGGDGADGIQAIANNISASLAGSDANGVVDLSDKLDDELSIVREVLQERISSIDTNYFDPPIPITSAAPEIPKFFLQITKYTLKYSANFQTIDVDFAELWQYYQQATGDLKDPERSDEWKNKLNLSQLTIVKPGKSVDIGKAIDTLDTNIFELVPSQNQRQLDINNFFNLFNQLIGTSPSFADNNNDNVPETITNRDDDLTRRISSAPDNQNAFITRTDEDADENNVGKTLQTMRNRLNQYLLDVDSVVEEVDDSRPEYINKSSGFLKLRRLNQSILIKGTGETPSFGNWTQDGFTITMWVRFLNTTGGGNLFTYGNPMIRTNSSFRLETFTVQKDELSIRYQDVDYTYAKPRRVLRLSVWENRQDDLWWQSKVEGGLMDWPYSVPWDRKMGYVYDNSVPLDIGNDVWNEGNGPLGQGFKKLPTWHAQMPANQMVTGGSQRQPYSENFLQYTNVPTDDLEEWFFICATYNPSVNEIASFGGQYGMYVPYGSPSSFHNSNPDVNLRPGTAGFTNSNSHLKDDLFWLGHKNQSGDIVSNSGFGNRCKVEIISRSDLLRARGFRI